MSDEPKTLKFIIGSLLNAFMFMAPGIVVVLDPERTLFNRLITGVFTSSFWIIGEAVLYKIYWKRVKPVYPLGVADPDDIYFPRFNIPRPLYLDERKRKQREATQSQPPEEA